MNYVISSVNTIHTWKIILRYHSDPKSLDNLISDSRHVYIQIVHNLVYHI